MGRGTCRVWRLKPGRGTLWSWYTVHGKSDGSTPELRPTEESGAVENLDDAPYAEGGKFPNGMTKACGVKNPASKVTAVVPSVLGKLASKNALETCDAYAALDPSCSYGADADADGVNGTAITDVLCA